MIELLLWPLVAGFVLAGIHAYFGMHVLARGVVFVDLSLAQVAALGLTIAILAWALGAGLTAVGLYASWTWDLPTGPKIVTAFGAATALVVPAHGSLFGVR